MLQNLNSNSPQDDDFDCTIASLPDNMAKNRFKVHLPGEISGTVLQFRVQMAMVSLYACEIKVHHPKVSCFKVRNGHLEFNYLI